MNAQLTCHIIFPPQANKYQVSIDSQSILVRPHPANLIGLGWNETWTIPITGRNNILMTLDLDHPILHWMQKVRRHYKVMGTDMNNVHIIACGNLMEKQKPQDSVNNEIVLEESDIKEDIDNGEVKPPQVEDNFTPHQ